MRPDLVRKFAAQDLRRFLAAVDRHLQQPASLIVIGGSACALGYGVGIVTSDVDTYNAVEAAVAVAVERARAETALPIPVERSPVADLPFEFETRLRTVLPDLVQLRVLVLEKHDLALSKTLRGNQHDLEAIEELHRIDPLDEDILVERYVTELSAAIGDPQRLDQNIVLLVHCLYGEIEADRVKKRLARLRTPASQGR